MSDGDKLEYTIRHVLQTATKILFSVGFILPFLIRIKSLFQDTWENIHKQIIIFE